MTTKKRSLKLKINPVITLNDEGYGDLLNRIREEVEEGEKDALWEVTSLIVEIRPAKIEKTEKTETENAE